RRHRADKLIEVLEGNTIHAEFLSNKGEGLHHIGFRVPDLNQVVDTLAQRGIGVLQSAFREGARYAYMDPTELGGIMFEFVERAAS
ncbi:MAG: VOC family protein, partial [Betaproteobacteria bacterium]|nr:VOC family protein [Betaproteobacteria bacterium]